MKFYTLALCAALGVASQVQAAGIFSRSGDDERVPSGWEIGAAIGSHKHSEKVDIADLGTFVAFDTSSTAYKLFGGYRFNRYFTAEVAYIDGGDGAESFIDPNTLMGFRVERKGRGYQASVLGALPLGSSAFSLFGRVGFMDWKLDELWKDDLTGLPMFRSTADGSDPFFGGGLVADLDGAVLRLEYEYVDFDVQDADGNDLPIKSTVISLSVAWIF